MTIKSLNYLKIQMMHKTFWYALAIFILSIAPVEGVITTTTNETAISSSCTGTPFFKLNLCNISCSTCTSSNNNECQSCDANFTLVDTFCTLSNNSYTFIYLTYFTAVRINPTTDLFLWKNRNTDKVLDGSNLVHICSPAGSTETYQFFMVGLWSKNDQVEYSFAFTDTISELTIEFNLLLLLNNVELTIFLGQVTVFTQGFTTLGQLNATYFQSSNSTTPSYLNIDGLSSSNIATVVQQINADISVNTKAIDLRFVVNSQSGQHFWAMSDVVILYRECSTCPKEALLSQISGLGAAIGYTSAIVIPGVILLYIFIQLGQYLKQRKKANQAGSKSLPLRGIKRVIDSISSLYKKGKKNRNSTESHPRAKTIQDEMTDLKKKNDYLYDTLFSHLNKGQKSE